MKQQTKSQIQRISQLDLFNYIILQLFNLKECKIIQYREKIINYIFRRGLFYTTNFRKSGQRIDGQISNYKKIGIIEDQIKFDFAKSQRQLEVSDSMKIEIQRFLMLKQMDDNIFKTNQFKNKEFIIYIIWITIHTWNGQFNYIYNDKQPLQIYDNKLVIKYLEKILFIQASLCSIRQAKFQTINSKKQAIKLKKSLNMKNLQKTQRKYQDLLAQKFLNFQNFNSLLIVQIPHFW
ncbi:unnamed protein product [Paramecium pentaurelia]|uniref:Uncharacterized protein n=1 Tax=Paramecium pentaurelia TaxID=43138 RepID=A0A8S1WTP0_9CILI|nr:unnamed protein product [Paramecium pentaurelia]